MSNKLVLIVDDDDAVRKSLVRYMEDTEYQVLSAASYEQAIEILGSDQPHVAVVDMRLAGNSGETLILSAHAICPKLRFLVYTGSNTFEITPSMKKVGIEPEDILRKPVESLSVIHSAIDRVFTNLNGGEN